MQTGTEEATILVLGRSCGTLPIPVRYSRKGIGQACLIQSDGGQKGRCRDLSSRPDEPLQPTLGFLGT